MATNLGEKQEFHIYQETLPQKRTRHVDGETQRCRLASCAWVGVRTHPKYKSRIPKSVLFDDFLMRFFLTLPLRTPLAGNSHNLSPFPLPCLLPLYLAALD